MLKTLAVLEREVILRHIGSRDLDRIHRSLLLWLLNRLLHWLRSRLLYRLLHGLVTALLVLRLSVCRSLSRTTHRTLNWSLSLSRGRPISRLPLWLVTALSLSTILSPRIVRLPPKQLQIVHRDFRGVPLVASLVCPRSGPQLALNVNLSAFADVLLRHISRIPPGHYVVPFSVLSKFSIAVTIAFSRRKGERRHLCAS